MSAGSRALAGRNGHQQRQRTWQDDQRQVDVRAVDLQHDHVAREVELVGAVLRSRP